jgi:hypothetical protein
MPLPDYTGNPTYRLSTAERDQAVTELRQHVAEGRLTEAEFTERSKAARIAVSRGDLAPLFADLPATTFPSSAAAAQPAAPQPAYGRPPVSDGQGPPAVFDEPIPVYGAPEEASATVVPSASVAPAPTSASGVAPATQGWGGPQRREPGRVGATIMALVPFASLGLFFASLSVWHWPFGWIWFGLIPVAGKIIYGPNGKPPRRRR